MNLSQQLCNRCGGEYHSEEPHFCPNSRYWNRSKRDGWVPPIKPVLLERDEVIERLDNVI